MRTFLCIAVFLSFTAIAVNALQCYQCLSNRSWSECDSKKMLMTCPAAGSFRCAKSESDVKAVGMVYQKGCLLNSTCSTHCSNPTFSKCQINCCTGDKCNGVGTLTSGISTIAVAFLAVMKCISTLSLW